MSKVAKATIGLMLATIIAKVLGFGIFIAVRYA